MTSVVFAGHFPALCKTFSQPEALHIDSKVFIGESNYMEHGYPFVKHIRWEEFRPQVGSFKTFKIELIDSKLQKQPMSFLYTISYNWITCTTINYSDFRIYSSNWEEHKVLNMNILTRTLLK